MEYFEENITVPCSHVPMYVTKASGKRVKFQPSKVRRTCLRAGASSKLAREITKNLSRSIYDGMSTRKVLDLILAELARTNPQVAARYNLKQAMLELGPAGFVFEKFIVRFLREYGYEAYCPPILKGACIPHEVDILARRPIRNKISNGVNQGKAYMIECKYHNARGIYTGSKDILYVWARFLDLKEAGEKRFDEAWIISNTKFSIHAIEYGQCKKMRLLGWKYPAERGLEKLIEAKQLYPVTILRGMDRATRDKLFSNDFIFCQDLIKTEKHLIMKRTGIKEKKLRALINEASNLLGGQTTFSSAL